MDMPTHRRQIRFTRRKVLRLTGGILAAAPFMVVAGPAFAQQPDPVITPATHAFGRSIQVGTAIRDQPSTQAKLVRRLKWNEVIAVKGQTTSDISPTAYNKIWYQTDDGFVYSAFIQPVENAPNQPVTNVEDPGFWGEVTVPFTEARYAPGAARHALLLLLRLYFQSNGHASRQGRRVLVSPE